MEAIFKRISCAVLICFSLAACGGGSGGDGSSSGSGGSGGGNNPFPVIMNFSPASVVVNSGAFTLTVNGEGFIPGSTLFWDGSQRAVTYISANQITAEILVMDTDEERQATVEVSNPPPGGGSSGAMLFPVAPPGQTVTNPPVITSLTPSILPAGSGAFTLQVQGSAFQNNATVRWNGGDRPTTFVSENQVDAQISAADLATNACVNVTVANIDGGISELALFTIGPVACNPVANITAVTPESIAAGSGAQTVTLTGTGFVPGSTVRLNGSARTTTFVSATTLDVAVTAGDVAAQNVQALSVFNPAPGGGLSNPENLFVLGATATYFSDNFDRANSEELGNGWTEKTATAYNIRGGELESTTTDMTYRDNAVYRPAGEDRQSVEISMEFVRRTVTNGFNFPQVHARIQRDTINQNDTMQSYIFLTEDLDDVVAIAINRNVAGEGECHLTETPMTGPPLVNGRRYRLRFQVSGTNPVVLNGILEEYNSAGGWDNIVTSSATHDATTTIPNTFFCGPGPGQLPPPITGLGAQGFSKWFNETDLLDNFYWIEQ